jgi:ActR/RegA family two-component response regulator
MNEAILLIEDDATFSATLARALKRRGYQVLTAANPELAALAVVQAEAPDWIVLDLNLDGASGMALIPRLRERLPDCRIVVLTGYASITTAVDAIKLGAVQYLAKPVDVDTLLRAFGHSLQADATSSAMCGADRGGADVGGSHGMGTHPACLARAQGQHFFHRAGAQHASPHLAAQASETAGAAVALRRIIRSGFARVVCGLSPLRRGIISAPRRRGRAPRSAAGRFR